MPTNPLRLCAFTILAVFAGREACAQGHWTPRNPLPTSLTFNAALWTGTEILAVGDLGAVYTSPDGKDWESHALKSGDHFKALAQGGGRFAAVGYLAAEQMSGFLSSRDGRTWTTRPHAKYVGLHDILWTGRSFVAVGDSGTILTSADGEAWTRAVSGTRRDLLKVAQGDSLLMAVGDSGTVTTSRDGQTWTVQSTGRTFDLHKVAYGGGRFVAAGAMVASRSYGVLLSSDGAVWSESRVPAHLYSLRWVKDRFLASGLQEFFQSRDGETWERRPTEAFSSLQDWVHTGRHWVGVGTYGAVIRSEDGENFTLPNPPVTWKDLDAVAWGSGQFVAVGAEGEIVVSPDGHRWERSTSGVKARLRHVAEHGGTWVAVGDSGILLTSPDGRAWTRRPSGSREHLFGVAWCGTRWVATGDTVALRSPDGIAWSRHSLNVGLSLTDLVEDPPVWSGSRMVLLGRNGLVLTSADGAEWQPGTRMEAGRPTPFFLWSLVWDGTRFLGHTRIANLVEVVASPDGIAWTSLGTGKPEALGAERLPIRAGRHFVAAGIVGTSPAPARYGWIALSQDGTAWTGLPIPGSLQLYSVAASADRVVAVGFRGTILSSPIDSALATRPTRTAHAGFALRGDRNVLNVIPLRALAGTPFQARLLGLRGETFREAASRGAAAGLRLEGLASGNYVVEVRGDGEGGIPLCLPYVHP